MNRVSPSTYRGVRVIGTGSTSEALRMQTLPMSAPGPNEVRIRVEAIGLNRAENVFRKGRYMYAPNPGAPIGYEAAGVVDAIGSGVSDLAVGDWVSTVPAFSMNDYGVYGEYAIVPAYAAVKYPPSLSPQEAASIWMQYITAYGALIHHGELKRGQTVLLTAATGGVGIAAIQMAKQLGATTIATTRKADKAALLRELGADHVIVTESDDLPARVMEITQGRGAEIVFDAVGGAGFAGLIEATARYGRVYIYGALAPDAVTGTPFPWRPVLSKRVRIQGYLLFELTYDPLRFGAQRPFDPEAYPRAIAFTLQGLQSGAFKPVIAREFDFEDLLVAHDFVESDAQTGKVVVRVPT
ncbi:MAG TPA: zinc-dependent alcohol dehydrogenase family protein [Albitalea sp.]|nr:zinc-dependent alcohol dehydrogenase family protein [Albitalea sp.]